MNLRVSGPVLTSLFLLVLNHSRWQKWEVGKGVQGGKVDGGGGVWWSGGHSGREIDSEDLRRIKCLNAREDYDEIEYSRTRLFQGTNQIYASC